MGSRDGERGSKSNEVGLLRSPFLALGFSNSLSLTFTGSRACSWLFSRISVNRCTYAAPRCIQHRWFISVQFGWSRVVLLSRIVTDRVSNRCCIDRCAKFFPRGISGNLWNWRATFIVAAERASFAAIWNWNWRIVICWIVRLSCVSRNNHQRWTTMEMSFYSRQREKENCTRLETIVNPRSVHRGSRVFLCILEKVYRSERFLSETFRWHAPSYTEQTIINLSPILSDRQLRLVCCTRFNDSFLLVSYSRHRS